MNVSYFLRVVGGWWLHFLALDAIICRYHLLPRLVYSSYFLFLPLPVLFAQEPKASTLPIDIIKAFVSVFSSYTSSYIDIHSCYYIIIPSWVLSLTCSARCMSVRRAAWCSILWGRQLYYFKKKTYGHVRGICSCFETRAPPPLIPQAKGWGVIQIQVTHNYSCGPHTSTKWGTSPRLITNDLFSYP